MSRPTAKRFPTRALAAAAAVALGLGLSACSTGTGSPGVAAYVGDTEVSEIAVTSAIKDWHMLTGEEVPRADMTLALAQANIVVPIGERTELVNPEEVDAVIAELSAAQGDAEPFKLSAPARELVSYFVTMQALQMGASEEAYAEILLAMEETDVHLNPRYGSIENGSFVPAGTLGDAFTEESVIDIFG